MTFQAEEQIAFADRILLNKVDLMEGEAGEVELKYVICILSLIYIYIYIHKCIVVSLAPCMMQYCITPHALTFSFSKWPRVHVVKCVNVVRAAKYKRR